MMCAPPTPFEQVQRSDAKKKCVHSEATGVRRSRKQSLFFVPLASLITHYHNFQESHEKLKKKICASAHALTSHNQSKARTTKKGNAHEARGTAWKKKMKNLNPSTLDNT